MARFYLILCQNLAGSIIRSLSSSRLLRLSIKTDGYLTRYLIHGYNIVIRWLYGFGVTTMAKPLMAVRLPLELEQSLLFCAKELHKSKSELVQEALASYLEDLQDYISAKSFSRQRTQLYFG